jgi:hypothetical protein
MKVSFSPLIASLRESKSNFSLHSDAVALRSEVSDFRLGSPALTTKAEKDIRARRRISGVKVKLFTEAHKGNLAMHHGHIRLRITVSMRGAKAIKVKVAHSQSAGPSHCQNASESRDDAVQWTFAHKKMCAGSLFGVVVKKSCITWKLDSVA